MGANTRANQKDSHGLRLPELVELLDARDHADPDLAGDEPAYVRFRRVGLTVQVTHPGGNEATCKMSSRLLSRDRIRLLHGGFLHQHSRCQIQLITVDGQRRTAKGIIESCEYLRAPVHEITVRLEFPLPADALTTPEESSGDEPAVAPGLVRLSGDVLLICESDHDRALIEKDMREHGVDIASARFLGPGLDLLRKDSFDVVAVDLDLSGIRPDEIVRSIRRANYKRPLIGMTWFADRMPPALADPKLSFLEKPYQRADFVEALSAFLKGEPPARGAADKLPWTKCSA